MMNYNMKPPPNMQTTLNSSLSSQQLKLENITTLESQLQQSQSQDEIGQKSIKRLCDIAWAAGFFDGEGCIGLDEQRYKRKKPRDKPLRPFIPNIQLNNTDKDLIVRFATIVGYGNVTGPYKTNGRKNKPTHKATYFWKIAKQSEVKRILLMLLPYFGERRKLKAEQALYHLNETPN